MTIDVWMQHPTQRFLATDMLASLQRWTGGQIPNEQLPIDVTVAAMDAAGVDVGLLTPWRGPNGQDLVSNDEVADWVRQYPTRFAGLAAVDLDRPMTALSGGQAARAGLASLLLSRYDVFLLDEPTNDLDLDGLARLEDFVTSLVCARASSS